MIKQILYFLLFISITAQAQDETLTLMQYNLTYYGNTGPSFINCDNVTNSTADKNGYLTTIINDVLPDVFGVNEVGNNINYVNEILNNVLNTNGRSYYKNAVMNGSGDIINMLYYNSNKLQLYSEDAIIRNLDGSFITRHIDVHTLYYKDPNLASGADTVFMTFIVAHLKAGSSTDDLNARDEATKAVMNYLENTGVKGYCFFMGDLNSRSSNEAAIQHLVDYTAANLNFVDPINQLGDWQSSAYADIHTQSTRSNDDNGGCFSTGGMDDRFDLILMTQQMEFSTAKVQYMPGTYKAYGQDGNAYNSSLRISNNSVVSSTIAQALYDMSDHLPVVMDIGIYPNNSGVTGQLDIKDDFIEVNYSNPLNGLIHVRLLSSEVQQATLEVMDPTGKLVYTTTISQEAQIHPGTLANGVYFLRIHSDERVFYLGKMVKAH